MNREQIINQLKEDEGFRELAYWDKKQWTYGYGCRAPGKCSRISEADALPLLENHVDTAIAHFQRIFNGHTHKFNDVRTGAFVNLIFNMGPGMQGGSSGLLSFKNTLNFIFKSSLPDWEKVAAGLKASLWFRQVGDSGTPPGRGNRIVAEVRTGVTA